MACAREIGTEEIVRILKSPEAVKAYEENGVNAAYLYGSAANGRMHAHSDVDVAVVFRESAPKSERFLRRLSLITIVMGLLGLEEVDVVPLNDAPLLLAFNALNESVVLYKADELEAAEFEIKTFSMYYDFRPVLDGYCTEMSRRIKERGLA